MTAKKEKKLFSLVIPAYKQEKTIIEDVKNLSLALSVLPYKYEIIVVVDGFLDNTYKKLKTKKYKHVIVIGYEKNKGKGYAIKQGVLRAKGAIIGFIDAGMDLDPQAVTKMLDVLLEYQADIIIGSKLHPDSKVHYPFIRRVMSWGYRSLLYTLFNLNVADTQVGLKIFKKKVAKDVFPRILVKKFAFDVEVLAVAKELGYDKIYEAPIKLHFKGGSITSKTLWTIIFWMLWDTCAVYYRLKIMHYYRKK